jgi:DNA polymerase-1
VREGAASAGRLLFGDFPIDFPLDLHIAPTAEKQ